MVNSLHIIVEIREEFLHLTMESPSQNPYVRLSPHTALHNNILQSQNKLT